MGLGSGASSIPIHLRMNPSRGSSISAGGPVPETGNTNSYLNQKWNRYFGNGPVPSGVMGLTGLTGLQRPLSRDPGREWTQSTPYGEAPDSAHVAMFTNSAGVQNIDRQLQEQKKWLCRFSHDLTSRSNSNPIGSAASSERQLNTSSTCAAGQTLHPQVPNEDSKGIGPNGLSDASQNQ